MNGPDLISLSKYGHGALAAIAVRVGPDLAVFNLDAMHTIAVCLHSGDVTTQRIWVMLYMDIPYYLISVMGPLR